MAVLLPIEFGVKISRPPEEVFTYLTKWERQFEWQEGIMEARFLTPGFGVGIVCRKTRRTPQGDVTFDVKIVGCDLDALWWEEELASGPNRGSRWKWRVEPDGSGSVVFVDVQMHASGLRGLAKGSVRQALENEMKSSLDRLKHRLENPAPR